MPMPTRSAPTCSSSGRDHGVRHFRIEEEILLPALATGGDPSDEAVVRVLVDCVWIRERMERPGPSRAGAAPGARRGRSRIGILIVRLASVPADGLSPGLRQLALDSGEHRARRREHKKRR
jgi:hypothetical protein